FTRVLLIVKSKQSLFIIFFFSSRRRHTRSKRDWSSDVCSSDLGAALGTCVGTPLARLSLVQLAASRSGSLTKERRDSMSPAQVIEELKKGNERFRTGKMTPRDYLAEKRASAAGQNPAAVILGCVDSR